MKRREKVTTLPVEVTQDCGHIMLGKRRACDPAWALVDPLDPALKSVIQAAWADHERTGSWYGRHPGEGEYMTPAWWRN